MNEEIIKEAKRIEEDSIYSAKAHFYAAQFWTNFHLWIGIPSAVLAAVAGASALSDFDNSNILAGALSIFVSVLTAVATFVNPKEKANIHQKAGNEYNSLKNEVRIFSNIETETLVGSVEIATGNETPVVNKTLVDEIKRLSNKRDELNKKSPQIPRWAFKKARKGIEEGESVYKVDNLKDVTKSD